LSKKLICVHLHSISKGNTTEGTSTTSTKNHDLRCENAQYGSVHKSHDKTVTVPHQTALSGEEYALSTKTTNNDFVKQPKPTPAPMEYAFVELQKKTTESTPQQLVAGYDVLANKGVSLIIHTSVPVEQWVSRDPKSPKDQRILCMPLLKPNITDNDKCNRLGFLFSTLLKPKA